MANVLIIDDEEMVCEILSRQVKSAGHRAIVAFTLGDGLEKALSNDCDVIFLDVNLPDGNGLEALPRFRRVSSAPEVIIITGAGAPDGAELAIRCGAWDYLRKPFPKGEAVLQLIRALQYRKEKSRLKATVALKRNGIVGKTPEINACLNNVALAVQTNANVLITGETGTGKELFARAIHENSSRAGENFIIVDCTVLPEKLVESVLFGHRKGAFTGADRAHEGLIKQADHGTLFLDEIGELPLDLQKTFLRVIQEHRFRPVGGTAEVKSDFRLVAATNRDLDQMVESGDFRQDLLFRLQSYTIELPPLRDRIQDIRELAMYHVAKLCELNGLENKGFSPEFFEALAAYDWPGNARELVNILDQAVIADPANPVLFPKHLPDRIRIKIARASLEKGRSPDAAHTEAAIPSVPFPKLKALRNSRMAELEHQYLRKLMCCTKGDIKEACHISGLKRARLYEMMKKYNVIRVQ